MPPKKTLAQLGRVEGEGISFQAHIQYRDEQDKRNKNIHIRGPTRSSRRRAERDLLSIRKASEGHSVWAEAIAAMYAKSRELCQEAEFENNVAMGLAQYGFARDAHKVVDSDPESEGDAAVDHDDSFEAADFSNPEVVKKFFPPPPPRPPRAPPTDAADATRQLADFMPNSETPEALRVLLDARADPNLIIATRVYEPEAFIPEFRTAMREFGIGPKPGQTEELSILMYVMGSAREEHLQEMVDLFRHYGAKYGAKEHHRYLRAREALRCDPIYLRDFHRSATAFDVTKSFMGAMRLLACTR